MTSIDPGEHPLDLGDRRDGLLFIPRTYRPDTPAPLAVMLHGAGGTGAQMRFTYEQAETLGVIIMSPDSRDPRSWDVIVGDFGPDVQFLERALEQVSGRCAVAADRMAIGGFSDGASYALSIGLARGDLFSDIAAFSPGFIAPVQRRGQPRIFISHGIADTVLPVDPTSRRIVPQLTAAGYSVVYREFEGGHEVPRQMVYEALSAVAA